MTATCVVFAYHDVGVRCLSVLLEKGLDVRLVVTHRDDPGENVFFASVEALARRHGLEVEVCVDAAAPALLAKLQAIGPDFLFSFYYRRMLPAAVLAVAKRGAFNVHGSLLPRYRGRAPVNWAVLHGERETGATLHEMVDKPDAGRIVGQEAVPIGADDTAGEVFARVTDAAEAVLRRELPRLLEGTATLTPQDLARGSYFGGRKPEDGRIDFARGAREIHDLVRAVAPPYPGAFTEFRGAPLKILRTRVASPPGTPRAARLRLEDGRVFIDCADGGTLEVLELEHAGRPLRPEAFCDNIGPGVHALAPLLYPDRPFP
jgi:methionyl-tRNA formyltransferase